MGAEHSGDLPVVTQDDGGRSKAGTRDACHILALSSKSCCFLAHTLRAVGMDRVRNKQNLS